MRRKFAFLCVALCAGAASAEPEHLNCLIQFSLEQGFFAGNFHIIQLCLNGLFG